MPDSGVGGQQAPWEKSGFISGLQRRPIWRVAGTGSGSWMMRSQHSSDHSIPSPAPCMESGRDYDWVPAPEGGSLCCQPGNEAVGGPSLLFLFVPSTEPGQRGAQIRCRHPRCLVDLTPYLCSSPHPLCSVPLTDGPAEAAAATTKGQGRRF